MEATMTREQARPKGPTEEGHTHGFSLMKAGSDGGDIHITWDPADEKSVEEARQQWTEKVVAGPFNAYAVKLTPTRTGEPLTEFDPESGQFVLSEAQQVVATPPLAGG